MLLLLMLHIVSETQEKVAGLQFSRTVATQTGKGPALVALMSHFEWGKAAMLTSKETVWRVSSDGIAKELRGAGVMVHEAEAFEAGQFKAVTLDGIKRSGYHFVILISYDPDAEIIASSAAQRRMLDAGHSYGIYSYGPIQAWPYISAAQRGMLDMGKQLALVYVQTCVQTHVLSPACMRT